MADKFDPYREALVMETQTIWPEEYDHLDVSEKQKIEASLHADPENAGVAGETTALPAIQPADRSAARLTS